MKGEFRIFSIIFSIFFLNNSYAGSPAFSESEIDGYFLGYKNHSEISVTGNSKEFIQELKNICEKQGTLWALGVNEPLICKKLEEVKSQPFGDSLRTLVGYKDKTIDLEERMYLFSTKPIKTLKERDATVEEIRKLQNLLKNDESYQYESVIKAVKERGEIKNILIHEKIIAVESSSKRSVFYLVPWIISEDGTGGRNMEYIVIHKFTDKYSVVGGVTGKLQGFADLNNDGYPEIYISTDCDGVCEMVVSFRETEAAQDENIELIPNLEIKYPIGKFAH